jgi:hypothetical protein
MGGETIPCLGRGQPTTQRLNLSLNLGVRYFSPIHLFYRAGYPFELMNQLVKLR